MPHIPAVPPRGDSRTSPRHLFGHTYRLIAALRRDPAARGLLDASVDQAHRYPWFEALIRSMGQR